jgi:hypothetical protein
MLVVLVLLVLLLVLLRRFFVFLVVSFFLRCCCSCWRFGLFDDASGGGGGLGLGWSWKRRRRRRRGGKKHAACHCCYDLPGTPTGSGVRLLSFCLREFSVERLNDASSRSRGRRRRRRRKCDGGQRHEQCGVRLTGATAGRRRN